MSQPESALSSVGQTVNSAALTSPHQDRVGLEAIGAYEFFFQKLLWPAMNIAFGRSIHQKIAFLNQSQWWPKEKILDFQIEKLRRLLENAYQRVPFYRNEMIRRGLRPEDIRYVGDLETLPVVTKAIIKQDAHEFLAEGYQLEKLVKDSTGGSTNEPTSFYRSREQDSWHWALKYRMWGMAGYRLGVPYLNIYNMRRTGLRKRLQDRLLRNHAYYLFEGTAQEEMLSEILQILSHRRIQFLAGCTTTILILAQYRASLGKPPPLSLKSILTTGSLLTERDRAFIEEWLRAPVWDHYGLGGEGAHVAAECEEKKGYHINVENVLIEPADKAKVDLGESTGILVTVLDNHSWPLIRYESGDEAVFSTRECRCGRGLPLLERIDGRVSEVIAMPNGVRLNTHFFSVVFAELNDVAQYQVEQMAPDHLLLRVVWRTEGNRENISRWMSNKIAEMVGGRVKLTIEGVDQIPLLPSGKHRFIIPWRGEMQ